MASPDQGGFGTVDVYPRHDRGDEGALTNLQVAFDRQCDGSSSLQGCINGDMQISAGSRLSVELVAPAGGSLDVPRMARMPDGPRPSSPSAATYRGQRAVPDETKAPRGECHGFFEVLLLLEQGFARSRYPARSHCRLRLQKIKLKLLGHGTRCVSDRFVTFSSSHPTPRTRPRRTR